VNNEKIRIENYPHINAVIGPYEDRLFMAERGFVARNGQKSGWVPDFELPRGYVLDLIEKLLAGGAQWERVLKWGDLVDSIEGASWRKVVLIIDDQEFILGESRKDPSIPVLWVHIGSFPRNLYLLSSLAGLPNFSENRVLSVTKNSKESELLDIWFGWEPEDKLGAANVFSCVESARSAISDLQNAVETPVHGHAQHDLSSKFMAAGLSVPCIPEAYRPFFRLDRNWAWTTENEPNYWDDYMFNTNLDGPLPDHATIAHEGHGISSYALTWRMAIGPLALIVQTSWGGAYGDPSRDVGKQAELFHRVSRVVRHLAKKYPDFDQEPRMRRYQWKISNVSDFNELRQWDGRTMTWQDIEPAHDFLETFILDSPE